MNLQYIKTDACPVCGCCAITQESVEIDRHSHKIREHSCGGNWERRTFACGFEVKYVPNFNAESVSHECELDPKITERENKRKEAKLKLVLTIDELDTDDDYKARLNNAIAYV